MHDKLPQPGDDSHHGLFEQLQGIDADIVAEEIDEAIFAAEYQAESRVNQQTIVETMASREETPEQVVEALTILRNDPTIEAGDMVMRLFTARTSSPEETYPEEAKVLESIFGHIVSISCVLEGSITKKEAQLEVIGDDSLSPQIKGYLLDILDDLSDGGGIDFSDADAVSEALVALREQKDRAVVREKVQRIFQEFGARILRLRYNIHRDDPAWRDLCTKATASLIVRKDSECNGAPGEIAALAAHVLRSHEALDILHIPLDVYDDMLEHVYARLDEDWPF